MTPFAQSALYFVLMLGLNLFCCATFVRMLRQQNKPALGLRNTLTPYIALCAAIDLILAPYLPHLPQGGAASLLLPVCVLGVPAIQHSVLLTTSVAAKLR